MKDYETPEVEMVLFSEEDSACVLTRSEVNSTVATSVQGW